MPSAIHAERSTVGSGSCLATKPPLAPVGTMTAFLTICALTRPSPSVRKASRRALQRRAPRARGPAGGDAGVLAHLRLAQPEPLGAEVLAAVAPAQATPRHGAEPQVHTL